MPPTASKAPLPDRLVTSTRILPPACFITCGVTATTCAACTKRPTCRQTRRHLLRTVCRPSRGENPSKTPTENASAVLSAVSFTPTNARIVLRKIFTVDCQTRSAQVSRVFNQLESIGSAHFFPDGLPPESEKNTKGDILLFWQKRRMSPFFSRVSLALRHRRSTI